MAPQFPRCFNVAPIGTAEPGRSSGGKCQAVEQSWLETGQTGMSQLSVSGPSPKRKRSLLLPRLRFGFGPDRELVVVGIIRGAAAGGQAELAGLGAQGLPGNAQQAGRLDLVAARVAERQVHQQAVQLLMRLRG